MSQHLSLPQEYCVHVDNANDEQLFQTHGGHSNASAGFQRYLSCKSPSMKTPVLAEERNGMALEHANSISQSLTDFDFQRQFPFPLSGNESPQAGNCQVLWPRFISPNEAADLDFWLITDSSPQSPVGPSAVGHLSNQDFQFSFNGNDHLQPGNSQAPWPSRIPPSTAACAPTSSTTTISPSARPLAALSAAGLQVTAGDDIKPVGSPQIKQAATRRRKKDGLYRCALGDCNGTFTELHNLQYHINSHLHLKPYQCTECSYAAASPATLKRHMKRHQ